MIDLLHNALSEFGLPAQVVVWSSRALLGIAVVVLSILAHLITQKIALTAFKKVISRTSTTWDDVVVRHSVLDRLAYLAPALVVYNLASWPFADLSIATRDAWVGIVHDIVLVFIVIVGAWVTNALLNAVLEIVNRYELSRKIPAKGFSQVIKIAVAILSIILIFSILFDRNPFFFLSGLGAMTAVILLIFKDTIMGLVAGIQLSANKMVAVGDWIEMPKFGADGDVIDVALTTVKVQNWDKTITTIPAYALISDSFKNWQGMQESGGRRIKRAIHIDIQTIRFCTEDMLNRFGKIRYIAEYIQKKKDEISRYNAEQNIDSASLVNGRRMTNVGTFRAYVTAYLKHHPRIHQDMTFLVRQLAPTEHGLPIEIYVFSNDIAWANYEAIQADIFDHILAVIPEFDLRVFQEPSGTDLRALRSTQA
ncbi:MAG: mechanosensitive ion channel [bacterium]|nr:mechanosensitive ion channel [bacterium]